MTWIDIGALDADSRDWQLTQPFTGNLIKLKNEVSTIPPLVSNFRGLIALNYNFARFFNTQVFYSIPDEQLFLFQDFSINEIKRLAVRNISRLTKPQQWTIRAYVWDLVINPYNPNIAIDPVNLSPESLTEIETLINNSLSQIELTTQEIQQQNTQILTLMTGGI